MGRKRQYKSGNSIKVVVAPKQKLVRIMSGRKILKTYRFQMDIPFKMVEIECEGYNYSEWCVSERAYTYKKKIREYDQSVIKDIETKTLELYNSQNNH